MTIEFQCGNPACGKMLRASDGSAGRQASCPACGTVQIIPSPARPQTVTCGDCGKALDAGAALCPACGWVNPASFGPGGGAPPPAPPPASAPAAAPAARVGADQAERSFTADCLAAIPYAATNVGSIFKLVLWFVLVYGMFNVQFHLFGAALLGTRGGWVIVVLSVLAVQLIVGGYFLRFYLDCTIGSLEGADQAPDVPPFALGELMKTGLHGMGVTLVYVLPVVTLPLLPVGLMSLAYNNDARAFDVFRTARAAAKRPGPLLGLWLVILIWFAASPIAAALVWFLTSLVAAKMMTWGCFGFLLGLGMLAVGGVVVAVVVTMLTCMLFRCIGMLGRHFPEVAEALSDPPNSGVSYSCVGGGVVASVLLVWFGVPALLAALGVDISLPESEPQPPRTTNYGDAYFRNVLAARKKAMRIQTMNRLRRISLALSLYASKNGGNMPESLEDLVREGNLPGEDLRISKESSQEFRYVAGLTVSDGGKIVVYEPRPAGDGTRVVLLVNGGLDTLPERLFQARLAGQAQPASRPATAPAKPASPR